ncbi:hypothetical protein [Streptomyces mirabilis]|uniref:hypothetical protein n=1 Tax=Streptomyces mirabilis TaxID=68239 RepID=UPI0033B30D03
MRLPPGRPGRRRRRAREFAGAEPRTPELLVDVDERLVVPVTALLPTDDSVPCDGTFALVALADVFLRAWAQRGLDAADGISRTVISFTAQVLTRSTRTPPSSWSR